MGPTAHRIRILTIAVVLWVIWVEEPVGSDQWSVAHIPAPRFDTREACEQKAGELNDLERSIATMQRSAPMISVVLMLSITLSKPSCQQSENQVTAALRNGSFAAVHGTMLISFVCLV